MTDGNAKEKQHKKKRQHIQRYEENIRNNKRLEKNGQIHRVQSLSTDEHTGRGPEVCLHVQKKKYKRTCTATDRSPSVTAVVINMGCSLLLLL